MEEENSDANGTVRKWNRESVTGEPMSKKPKAFSDTVKLSIGEVVILANKQGLIDSSPYFASLFQFHANNHLDVVSLVSPENVDMNSFLAVLYSLSNGKVKLDISARNLWDFIVVAKYLQLDQMENECCTALRTMSLHLGMDELCQMWRKGHAWAFERITNLVVAAVSLRTGSVRQSSEFLDFTAEELVAFMSDDAFLPLSEKDVCKAVDAWCEHDPENRKKAEVLSPILAEIVWDNSANHLLEPFAHQFGKPEKPPKRVAQSETNEIPCCEGLDESGTNKAVGLGNYLYCLGDQESDESRYTTKVDFCRIDPSTKQPTALTSIGSEWGHEVESEYKPAKYCLCKVKISGHDKIGCFISSWHSVGSQGGRILYKYTYLELASRIGLYDPENGTWQILPDLPFPRTESAMIQCGTFLYVIGGTEYKPHMTGEGNADHCYRLDLTELTAGDLSDLTGAWVRIADLNIPRNGHSARSQYDRVIVHGGRTEAGVEDTPWSRFKNVLCSEAYDSELNIWTTFE